MSDSVRCGALARSLVVPAQPAEVRIGVIHDMTGPLAIAQGYFTYLGTRYAIDRVLK